MKVFVRGTGKYDPNAKAKAVEQEIEQKVQLEEEGSEIQETK